MGAYVVSNASLALTASTTQSLVLINPAVVDIVINEIGVSFDSASAATAIEVDLYRTTNSAGAAGSSATPIRGTRPGGTAAQSTALTNLSAEPTAVEVLRKWFVSPASGMLVLQFPLGKEPTGLGAGQEIGLRVITPAGVTPHALAYIDFSE